MSRAYWAATGLLLLATVGIYSTHFQNGFHFDDWHTVTNNSAIRDLANAPRFFTDPSAMSTLRANQVYRPLLPLSLAIDYRIGGGLKPWAFHVTTFLAFLVLLVLLVVLYSRLSLQPWVPFAAGALFAVHPVAAETVNYVVQRTDLWVALLMVAGLLAFMDDRARVRWFWPLPVAAAWLFKPTAVMFAPLLVLCLVLKPGAVSFKAAMRRSGPAWLLTLAMATLQWAMTPSRYDPGAVAAMPYWITQPRVALHYVTNFLAPFGLSADTDRRPFPSLLEDGAILGYLAVASLVLIAARTSRKAGLEPFALGLWWFLIALLPTALAPLAEVENDHRLFAPMIGLCLSAASGVEWLWRRRFPRVPALAMASALGILLAVLGAATWQRNQVWRSEATLWRDVVQKSPLNGRGWMNYGLTQMETGDVKGALQSYARARELTPSYYFLEINTGIALGTLGRVEESEWHFKRARILAPKDVLPAYYYARWLRSQQRLSEARILAQEAVLIDPNHQESKELLANIDGALAASVAPQTSEWWLDQSLLHYRARRFEQSLEAAKNALRLRPNYAEAYNNIAAAYEELGRWDEAIAAAEAALRLRPDFTLARNNLLYSKAQKAAVK